MKNIPNSWGWMSMRPYAYEGHNLFSHLEGTAQKAIHYLDKLGMSIICKRFRALNLELNNDDLKSMIKISALLHDIGKAADVYQDEGRTFRLHELPSAIICSRVCEALRLPDIEMKMIFMVVLQHMSTIRDWLEENYRDITFKHWEFVKYRREIEAFMKKHFSRSVKLYVTREEVKNKIKEVVDEIRRRKFYKLYTLILTPLTIADNIDSYEFRKEDLSEERKWFVEELMSLESA